jgi:hypothetical protein
MMEVVRQDRIDQLAESLVSFLQTCMLPGSFLLAYHPACSTGDDGKRHAQLTLIKEREPMELDDFLETEVAAAVAVTAALFSPRVRRVLRRGLVYTVAGGLIAGEVATSAARGIGRGVQHGMASARQFGQEGSEQKSGEQAKSEAAHD